MAADEEGEGRNRMNEELENVQDEGEKGKHEQCKNK